VATGLAAAPAGAAPTWVAPAFTLAEVTVGHRPGTPDNAPILGVLRPGVLVAAGHHRNGVLLAPVTADLVVSELAGEPAEHAFGPERFAAAPAEALS